MTTSLYQKYEAQREIARRMIHQLKRHSMWCLSKVINPHTPEVKASAALSLAKAALAQALLADGVKRPGFLESVDAHSRNALDFYGSFSDNSKNREVADCLVTDARSQILQGSLYSAEQDLRTALARLGSSASACQGELRDNLLSALGELAQAYIRDGQFERAQKLFEVL